MNQGFFTLGLHYWPARKGVYWWQDFDPLEVERDFKGLRALGMRLIRVHLMWEDFQPQLEQISSQSLLALREVLDLAQRHRIKVQVSFFSGHVAGVNFLPPWLLASRGGHKSPYPVFSSGVLHGSCRVRNVFEEPDLLSAQQRLIEDVVHAFHQHPALYGWDIGGGLSRLYPVPPRPDPNALPVEADIDGKSTPSANGDGPVGTLQWSGRNGRQDQVIESRASRNLWMGSVLDEEVDEDAEVSLEDLEVEPEAEPAPPPPAFDPERALVIRPLPTNAPPPVRPLLGLVDGFSIADADALDVELEDWTECDFASATPSAEQLARTLKVPDTKRTQATTQKKERETALAVSATDELVVVVDVVAEIEPDPVTAASVCLWLKLLTAAIRQIDTRHTISLSVESQVLDSQTPFDLGELAPLVDFIGVRAHPFESKWARSPLDTKALPFLAFFGEAVTGKRVALLEMGLPAVREEVYHAGRLIPYSLVHDNEAGDLSADVLEGLLRMGAMGGFCWNYSDFHPSLWNRPPLQQSPSTRYSGLIRLDGSLKPAAHVMRDFATWEHPLLDSPFFVKLQSERYRRDPRGGVLQIFDQFLEAVGDL